MNQGLGVARAFDVSTEDAWCVAGQKIFHDVDVAIGNLESPLLLDVDRIYEMSFAGNPRFIKFLSACKIRMVSIANNHIMEHGQRGFDDTLKILAGAEITPIGLAENGGSNLGWVQRNGLKIGCAAYCDIDRNKNIGLYADFNLGAITRDIREMESMGADVAIVCLHWGNEFSRYPSPRQMEQARCIIDSGANVVVGHHPHVAQPFEHYHGGLIFYSLGNFVFDMTWSRLVRRGLVPILRLSKQELCIQDLRVIEMGKESYIPSVVAGDTRRYRMQPSRRDSHAWTAMYGVQRKLDKLYHRILMKKTLLNNWNGLSPDVKRTIISNFKLFR